MGNSSYEGKEWTQAFIQFCGQDIKSVLDIGPGQGTYYHILNRQLADATWHAVEIFKPYIDKFNLSDFYDEVYNQDARDFYPSQNYDLIIAGDVLEHMTKDEAVALVNRLLKHTKHLLISIPIVKWPQDEINDNPNEVHVKDDWSHSEVIESFDKIATGFAGRQIGVYVLIGDL